MTTRLISMSKLHSILRLKYSAQLSHREIARSLNISPVTNHLKKANELGLINGQIQALLMQKMSKVKC